MLFAELIMYYVSGDHLFLHEQHYGYVTAVLITTLNPRSWHSKTFSNISPEYLIPVPDIACIQHVFGRNCELNGEGEEMWNNTNIYYHATWLLVVNCFTFLHGQYWVATLNSTSYHSLCSVRRLVLGSFLIYTWSFQQSNAYFEVSLCRVPLVDSAACCPSTLLHLKTCK